MMELLNNFEFKKITVNTYIGKLYKKMLVLNIVDIITIEIHCVPSVIEFIIAK